MPSELSSRGYKTAILAILVLRLGVAPALAVEKTDFKVQISIVRSSLRGTTAFRKYGGFFVDTTVVNTGTHDEHITVWTQYGWSWLSNNPDIHPGIEAAKNYSRKIVLMPGQTYSRWVEVWTSRKSDKPVTFRLGFVPNATLPVSGNTKRIDGWGGVYWSNSVTLHK